MGDQPALRMWANPGGVFNNVVGVTDAAVVFGRVSGESADDLIAAAEGGAGLKAIPLGDIKAVRANRRNHEIRVSSISGKKKTDTDLELADEATQDELYAALQQALGSSWSTRHVEMSAARAAVSPIIWLLIVGGLTYAGYMGAKEIDEGGDIDVHGRRGLLKRLLVWLMDVLGPTGMIVLGSVIGLLVVLVLVNRVRKPPIYDQLTS